jgi:hypothetical protein
MSLLMTNIGFSTTYYSNGTGGGAWGAAATWSPSGPPGCGDTIYIVADDVVTIENQQDYSACGSPMFVIIDSLGTLDFNTSGPKLKLPCNSGLIINGGGLMTSTGGGGGAANKLEICGSEVWRKDDGPQGGPFVFGTPLPIELLSFEANANGDAIDIKWVTAVEINNDYFTIEKSKNGITWETVLIVAGAGNSNNIIEYYEVDYSPIIGLSYYRLKQTDYDGKYSYSNIVNIVPVKFQDGYVANGQMNLFPNPVDPGGTVQVEFSNIFESELLVVLRDIAGKEFYSKVVINIEDGALVAVPIDVKIPSGIYLVTATSENRMYSQKLVVK